MKRVVLLLCLSAPLLFFAGCSTPRIDLAVAGMPNVNPDNSGRPSPVILKVYELRSDLAFNQADFQTLFAQPMQALGAELIAAGEVVFVPGEARVISYKPSDGVKFLGVVAGFRQMERARWRMIAPVNAESKNRIAIELNDASIVVVSSDKAGSWNPEEAVKQSRQQVPQSQGSSGASGDAGAGRGASSGSRRPVTQAPAPEAADASSAPGDPDTAPLSSSEPYRPPSLQPVR